VLQELLELKHGRLTFDSLVSFNNNLLGQGKEPWMTPFMPRDYNKGRFEFEFSQEYWMTQTQAENENRSTDDEVVADKQVPELKDTQKEEQPEQELDEYGEEDMLFAFGDLDVE